MRQKETNMAPRVFIPPHGRTATIEILVVVEPERTVRPGDLEELLDEIMERIDRALAGIYQNLPCEITAQDLAVAGPEHIPFYPATFGNQVFEDQTDVYAALDELRKGTPLEGLLYDSAGRAFEVTAWASFRREKKYDRKPSEMWTLDHE